MLILHLPVRYFHLLMVPMWCQSCFITDFELLAISDWLTVSKLSLNIEKARYMIVHNYQRMITNEAWWRHQMETFSALLTVCAGNSPVPGKFPHKSQWRGALMFSLICVWINGWVNNREAGDLRRYRTHYDVIVMRFLTCRLMTKHWTPVCFKFMGNRRRRCRSFSTMKLIYDSLSLSHLQFGIICWSFEWNMISKLLKRSLRKMTNSKCNSHTAPLSK